MTEKQKVLQEMFESLSLSRAISLKITNGKFYAPSAKKITAGQNTVDKHRRFKVSRNYDINFGFKIHNFGSL